MRRRSAHRRKGGNFYGGLILLLILGGLALGVWKALPLLPSLLKGTHTHYDRINIVLGGRQTVLVSYNQIGKSAVVVKLPGDLYLTEVIHGYGQYKVSSVYPAGELDHRGGETLAGTVQEYLGVPVDGYYYTNRTLGDLKTFFLSPEFLFEAKSNISLLDRLELAIDLAGVRFDKIQSVDLEKVASPLVLADGSTAISLEKEEVDSALSGMFSESRLQDENLRVEVINTTEATGLGSRAQRLLSNIGLTVVNVDSREPALPTCQIQADSTAFSSLTVSRIAAIYGCKIEKKDDGSRAAVTVMLGQNYADYLTK
ncbi:LCP family protein [Patescibacteria group bacterium]|nr:LCP family protein [Patescibacteria group bacterium]